MLSIKILSTKSECLRKKLMRYVSHDLPDSDTKRIREKLDEIDGHRNDMRKVTRYRTQTDIDVYSLYLSDLIAINKWFPRSDLNTTGLDLTWKSGINSSCKESTSNLFYEQACVMFNIAALYSQKALDDIPSLPDINRCEEACVALSIAAGYIITIYKTLVHTYSNLKSVPELGEDFLLGTYYYITATFQYLKARKAFLQNASKRLFVCVYMGSKYLYGEGVKCFTKAAAPTDFIECMKTMEEVSHAQALYYQGYMTDEQLANPEVHGTGVAYYCLKEFFDLLDKLKQKRSPVVTKHILPLLGDFTTKAVEQRRKVQQEWVTRMSVVPTDERSFVMQERIMKNTTLPELTPSFDFSVIFSDKQREELNKLIAGYQEDIRKSIEDFTKQYDAIYGTIAKELSGSEFEIMYAALYQAVELPDSFKEPLSRQHKQEEKQALSKCRRDYIVICKEFDAKIMELENRHADLVRQVNEGKVKESKSVTRLIQHSKHVIDDMKSVQTRLRHNDDSTEKWLKELTSERCRLRRSSCYNELKGKLSRVVSMDQYIETLYNQMLNSKNQLMEFLKMCDLMKERVSLIAGDYSMLIDDFLNSSENSTDAKSIYRRSFQVCESRMNMCLQRLKQYDSLMRSLNGVIHSLKDNLSINVLFKERYTIFKNLNIGLVAYDTCYNGYCNAMPKLQKNIDRLKDELNYFTQLGYTCLLYERKISDAGIEPATSRV